MTHKNGRFLGEGESVIPPPDPDDVLDPEKNPLIPGGFASDKAAREDAVFENDQTVPGLNPQIPR